VAATASDRQTRGVGSLLVITGPPGAGKSTVAQAVAAAADHSVLVEGDAFFAFLRNGRIDPWLAGSNEQNTIVTEAAAAAAGRFTLGGYATVYDGVIGPWFLETFAKATGLDSFEYAILLPSVELCVKQVAERTGHGFTDEAATRKMHKEFADARIARRHVLDDPWDSVDSVVERVTAAIGRGDLRYQVRRTD
jgi:cytidylate kinase